MNPYISIEIAMQIDENMEKTKQRMLYRYALESAFHYSRIKYLLLWTDAIGS